ncbi:MAG: hypothetical protein KDJ19_05545 [Hyphomicrobiaceae bacterium]|nr:hypothetical protein [Hyphomicrobiaceae bacterium]MCC0024201.1 hypothetical protein [Hyphomicrobiaceae bacterium]
MLSRQTVGWTIGAAILLLIAALFAALFAAPENPAAPAIDIADLLRMTLTQAAISTTVATISGTAIAIALSRLNFRGRALTISILSSAIVAPAIAVALGLLTIWGRAGLIADATSALGVTWNWSIFGLHGIVLAHAVLDAPLVARILIDRLDAIPADRLKLGQCLGLGPWQRIRIVDWPALAPALPGAIGLVFLLCFTSFPVVFLLGGGPANQTFEVAIYGAVRQSFDLGGAAQLALVQMLACLVVILPVLLAAPQFGETATHRGYVWRPGATGSAISALIVAMGLLFYVSPLIAPLLRGLTAQNLLRLFALPSFWQALTTSLLIGTASALLTAILALQLSLARAGLRSRPARTALLLPAYAYLLTPAVVISLGLFLIVRAMGFAPQSAAPFALIIGSVLLALPFALSSMAPAADAIAARYGKLIQSLDLGPLTRWRFIEWPLMRTSAGTVLAMAFCFSLGDLGIIALFGTEQFATLPWAINRALGAYRTNDAAAMTAILLVLNFAVFLVLPRLIAGRHTDA